MVVDSVYRRGGYEATLTSGSDGQHVGKPVAGDTLDPHYTGKALDFRTNDLKPEDLPHITEALKLCLGDEFVVLSEASHLHIQYGHIEANQ